LLVVGVVVVVVVVGGVTWIGLGVVEGWWRQGCLAGEEQEKWGVKAAWVGRRLF